MRCKEDETGDISCLLPVEHDSISFKVDQFMNNEDVLLDEYMA
jgi:hypothetical protein